jgi:hypothetical protein
MSLNQGNNPFGSRKYSAHFSPQASQSRLYRSAPTAFGQSKTLKSRLFGGAPSTHTGGQLFGAPTIKPTTIQPTFTGFGQPNTKSSGPFGGATSLFTSAGLSSSIVNPIPTSVFGGSGPQNATYGTPTANQSRQSSSTPTKGLFPSPSTGYSARVARGFFAAPSARRSAESAAGSPSLRSPPPPSAPASLTRPRQEAVPAPDWSTQSAVEKVLALIALQDFDGSWPTDNAQIAAILGIDIGTKPDPKAWVTLLVVRYLELKNSDESGIWGLVVDKARDWLAANVSAGLEDLEKEATEIVMSN